MIIAKDFWERIDKARGKLSILELSNKLNISYATLKSTKCRDKLPNLSDIVLISDYLGVTLDYLVTGKTSSNDLTQSELELIANYRACPPYIKTCIEMTAKQGCNTQQSVTTVTQKNLCG